MLIFTKLITSRWDDIIAFNVPGGGEEGRWRGVVYCPDGSWAKGYRHFTNTKDSSWYNYKGTYFVELWCFNDKESFSRELFL